ncbi:MAG: GNAT family N-acetyltransferase [Bacteroidaceae bacterium]|nr:GNAT family N-acetyltransferase [Bacteroidaceae bacterium]MBR4594082.1 GNAT family N-acetyltransferase [Bacteroidaceae bacterium]
MVLTSHTFRTEDYVLDHPEYSSNNVVAVQYEPADRELWNRFVKSSKNGTFLFDRGYMDYHSDRFTDCSLMFYKKGALLALLPANWLKDENTVQSHGGLTYGGLITGANFTAEDALEVFRCAIDWMKGNLGAVRWIYKPVPRIYSSLPADEDLYALSQNGATIKKREISSIVDLTKRIPLSTLRKRGFKKATKSGLTIVEGNFESDIEAYWNILTELLKEKYGSHPVHTLGEIKLLESRFPENIRLFVAKDGQEIVAGTLVYDTGTVVKTQYIASSAQGRASGALDMLFSTLMDDVFNDHRYMDYGTSTLVGGSNLNEGLISQKEGFGARAVVYDTYELLF